MNFEMWGFENESHRNSIKMIGALSDSHWFSWYATTMIEINFLSLKRITHIVDNRFHIAQYPITDTYWNHLQMHACHVAHSPLQWEAFQPVAI